MNLERNIFRISCSMIVVKCWVASCSISRFGNVETFVGMQRNSFNAYSVGNIKAIYYLFSHRRIWYYTFHKLILLSFMVPLILRSELASALIIISALHKKHIKTNYSSLMLELDEAMIDN